VTLDESESFSAGFYAFYDANNKKAGTYTRRDEDTDEWEFKANYDSEHCQI
jgi:hypothetical protein